MFNLQEVLDRAGIDPSGVHVMLHSPMEPSLQRILPALVKTNRSAMEAYQATHGSRVTSSLKSGRPWVMAFVKVGQDVPTSHSRMLFAGLYRNEGWRDRTYADIMAEPEISMLHTTYKTHREFVSRDPELTWPWFDLQLDPKLSEMQGRLVVSVALTPNYLRRAENIDAQIRAIHEESAFDADPPDWREWVVTGAEMRALPPGWATRLREWRGIYLITDRKSGRQYVGSAYNENGNLLGRWRTHVEGDAGVTAKLKDCDPADFSFSILERVSPDMDIREITALEQTWMKRLQTKTFGLNS